MLVTLMWDLGIMFCGEIRFLSLFVAFFKLQVVFTFWPITSDSCHEAQVKEWYVILLVENTSTTPSGKDTSNLLIQGVSIFPFALSFWHLQMKISADHSERWKLVRAWVHASNLSLFSGSPNLHSRFYQLVFCSMSIHNSIQLVLHVQKSDSTI